MPRFQDTRDYGKTNWERYLDKDIIPRQNRGSERVIPAPDKDVPPDKQVVPPEWPLEKARGEEENDT